MHSGRGVIGKKSSFHLTAFFDQSQTRNSTVIDVNTAHVDLSGKPIKLPNQKGHCKLQGLKIIDSLYKY